MSKKVHVSPSGVGFIKTDTKKEIPGAPEILKDAKRRPWLVEADNAEADNQTHHWVSKSDGRAVCQYCGIAYEGGIHNEETCPEAPK